MTVLLVVNDAPYASERPYNALRLATALQEDGEDSVRLFFLGDGAWCAIQGHTVPEGMHDIEWMLRRLLPGAAGATVCRTCMEARGIQAGQLIGGAHAGTLQTLKEWTRTSGRVLVF